jgi:hypothetical protein
MFVGSAAGPLDAVPETVAPKTGPRACAREATLAPNAAQLPCSGLWAAAIGGAAARATTAKVIEVLLVRMARLYRRRHHSMPCGCGSSGPWWAPMGRRGPTSPP